MNPEPHAEKVRHVLAGLLSTIDFKPSGQHPEAMLPWADQVLALLQIDGTLR